MQPRTIRNGLAFFTILAGLLAGLLGAADSTPAVIPASEPAPPPVSIRGRLTIARGLDLNKPDLTRAVVYLASNPALDVLTPASRPAIVAQRNKQFVPNFLAIPRNATVEFPNWDHFDHNVFSRSKAAPAFDLDRYPYGQSKSRQFTSVGVVQVFCNVHPDMRAIILVTPNICLAQADAEGRFEIRGVPPGKYELVAWHERCGEQRKPVEIASPDAIPEMNFTLEENRQSIIANSPPKNEGYGGVERGLGVKREQLNLPVVHDVHTAPATLPAAK